MKLIYKYKLIIIFFLSLVAITSVFKAFQNAQEISFDFHFSPTKLVSEGINHYQYILEGNHDHGPNDKIMYERENQLEAFKTKIKPIIGRSILLLFNADLLGSKNPFTFCFSPKSESH